MRLVDILEGYQYSDLNNLAASLGLPDNLARAELLAEVLATATSEQSQKQLIGTLSEAEIAILQVLKNAQGNTTLDALEMELQEIGRGKQLLKSLLERGVLFSYSVYKGTDEMGPNHQRIYATDSLLQQLPSHEYCLDITPASSQAVNKLTTLPDNFINKMLILAHNIQVLAPRILKSGRINQKSLKEISAHIYAPLSIADFKSQNIWCLAYAFLQERKYTSLHDGSMKISNERLGTFCAQRAALKIKELLSFWKATESWNDLFLVDELTLDDLVLSQFQQDNTALGKSALKASRKKIIQFLAAIKTTDWIDFRSFLHSIKASHIEFFLPRNNVQTNSYHLFREKNPKSAWGRMLSSHSLTDWDRVEGRMLAKIFTEVFFAFGLIAINEQGEDELFSFTHFRLTEAGYAALSGEDSGQNTSSEPGAIRLLSNFELLIYPEKICCSDLLHLAASCDTISYDNVLKTTLSKKSLVNYLQSFHQIETLLELYASLSTEPVPQNIEATVRDWARQTDQVLALEDILLVECKNRYEAKKMQDLLKSACAVTTEILSGVNLLVLKNEALKVEQFLSSDENFITEVYDYGSPEQNQKADDLVLCDTTGIRLARNFHDLYLNATLEKFCQHAKGCLIYTLTHSSFQHGKKSNWTYFEIVNFLSKHLQGRITPELYSYLKGWQGIFKPVELEKVIQIRFASKEDFEAVAIIPEIGSCFSAVTSSTSALVPVEKLRQLKSLLANLGVKTS